MNFVKLYRFCQIRSNMNETRWQPPWANMRKYDNNVNESMLDGVVLDDEIESHWGTDSRMSVSGEHGNSDRWWILIGGGSSMRAFLARAILRTFAGGMHMFLMICSAVGRRRSQAVVGAEGSRRFVFCKIPTPITAAAMLAAWVLGAGSSSRRSCAILTADFLWQHRAVAILYNTDVHIHCHYWLHPWVRVCGRSWDRLYLAAGIGFACLQTAAAAIRGVSVLRNAKLSNGNMRNELSVKWTCKIIWILWNFAKYQYPRI